MADTGTANDTKNHSQYYLKIYFYQYYNTYNYKNMEFDKYNTPTAMFNNIIYVGTKAMKLFQKYTLQKAFKYETYCNIVQP